MIIDRLPACVNQAVQGRRQKNFQGEGQRKENRKRAKKTEK